MDKFFVKQNQPSIYTEVPWHFKTSDRKIYETTLNLVGTEATECNGVLCYTYDYKSVDGDIEAKRMSFYIGDNVAFVYDVIESEKEISIYSDFVIQNEDLSLECNVADKSKLVIRNSETGIKHFRLMAEQEKISVMDKVGLLMPYKVKENGDIVYSMYEGLYNFGKSHRCLFGLTADSPEKIPGWHFMKLKKALRRVPLQMYQSMRLRFRRIL